MKTLITAATAATLLLTAPFAFADGRDHGHRGSWGHGGYKHGHYHKGYGPVRVDRYYYPAPRVVVPHPVYVPVPAPVVAVPAPYSYPYPHRPTNSVDIGFRIFF
jgi:hypothetical protein